MNQIDTDNVKNPYYGFGIFDEIVLHGEDRKHWEATAIKYMEQFVPAVKKAKR